MTSQHCKLGVGNAFLPGYRVYFVQRGDGLELVILLAGGDKSTQVYDIKSALQLVQEL